MTAVVATGLAFTVDAKPFANACAIAGHRITGQRILPILAGMLLEVTDGHLTVSGFDYDVAASATLAVENAADGRILVSGRLLGELVKTLPAKTPVKVSSTPGVDLRIDCGAVHLRLPAMTVEDYPELPKAGAALGQVDALTLGEAVEQVAPAADTSGITTLAALRGIHLTFEAEQIQLLASDRYRGALARIDWQPGAEFARAWPDRAVALVPATMLLDLARLAKVPATVTITLEEGTAGFALPDAAMVGRLLVAKDFPEKLPTMMPARSDTPIIVNAARVAAAVKRAAMVIENRERLPVRLAVDGQALTIGGTGTVSGDADEVVPCEYEGEPDQVVAHAPYLLDGLSSVPAKTAALTLPVRKRSPMLLTSASGTDPFRYFMMPIVL